MALEIERKFLLRETGIVKGLTGQFIAQGYLSLDPDATVRVRIIDSAGFLTVKGRNQGAVRKEFEYPIPLADARELLSLCKEGRIEKRRYTIAWADHIWEVDVFDGDNKGLVMAEVELRSENEKLALPPWIGREVTEDPRFFNSSLATKPYSRWKNFAPSPQRPVG
ncbi:MAG: CYTH domain-containing protein [Alcanivoracaceae bacterium]